MLLSMVTWIPSIYPLYVSIYTSTMDPMGFYQLGLSHSKKVEKRQVSWLGNVRWSFNGKIIMAEKMTFRSLALIRW